ncbi:MAG TPA: hypothetical protein VGJ22_03115 [Anaerolineales bacterium]|jgi:hypothetical protein
MNARARSLFIAFGLLAGLLLTRQYGESWDELKFYKYADSALSAYSTWPRTGEVPITGDTYDNYGPAYVMFVSLSARALGWILPWIESDLRHLIYFVTFLAGIWAFHRLAGRWLSRGGALGATLLFATQPLFWGHAFISPKDIPFLSFFMLSLVYGLQMVDSVEPVSGAALSPATRRQLLLATSLWLAFLFIFFGGTAVIHSWIESAVRAAAAGEPNFLARLASDIRTADPAVYDRKYFTLFLWTRALLFWLTTAFVGWLYYTRFQYALRLLARIAPAAILLGITACMRLLGPLAGLLVVLYALRRRGGTAPPVLVLYAFLAFIAMYATWPYLWPDPLGRFVESAVVMARYPWRGQVLFDGVLYSSTDIPRTYLPVLLGIQLTEPVWALFLAGLALTVLGAVRARRESHQLLVLTTIWFVLPLLGLIGLRSPLYDNFRQVFFILPPVFLLAGVVFEQIKKPVLQAALIALLILPGVVDGIRLHPYEYIYYNRFIGGERGAFRRFELDYWGTSYREAAAYLNETAPEHANIWVEGPAHLLQLYARRDLRIFSTYELERSDHYDYVVALSRYNLDQSSYPEARVVYTIARQDAIMTVIKQP